MRAWLRNFSFGLLALVVAVLIVSTCYQKYCGTAFVLDNIYHSTWFISLWGVIALTGLLYLFVSSIPRVSAAFVLHFAFVVV